MTTRVALAPPVPRTALTHATRYSLRSVCACAFAAASLIGLIEALEHQMAIEGLKAVAIWVQTAVTSAATAGWGRRGKSPIPDRFVVCIDEDIHARIDGPLRRLYHWAIHAASMV